MNKFLSTAESRLNAVIAFVNGEIITKDDEERLFTTRLANLIGDLRREYNMPIKTHSVKSEFSGKRYGEYELLSNADYDYLNEIIFDLADEVKQNYSDSPRLLDLYLMTLNAKYGLNKQTA